MSTVSQDYKQTTTGRFVASTLINMLQNAMRAPAGAGCDSTFEIEEQFELWQRIIESVPLMSTEYLFAHNWLTSGRKLWEDGDAAAAVYQLKQVARKLGW